MEEKVEWASQTNAPDKLTDALKECPFCGAHWLRKKNNLLGWGWFGHKNDCFLDLVNRRPDWLSDADMDRLSAAWNRRTLRQPAPPMVGDVEYISALLGNSLSMLSNINTTIPQIEPVAKVIAALLAQVRAEAEAVGLQRAAEVVKDKAAEIMQNYVMTGPAGIVSGCIAAIKALTPSPSPGAERTEGWRPIESAPKGVKIIGFCGGVRFLIQDANGQWRNMLGAPKNAPTHWMPLPAAPTKGDE